MHFTDGDDKQTQLDQLRVERQEMMVLLKAVKGQQNEINERTMRIEAGVQSIDERTIRIENLAAQLSYVIL